MISSGSVSESSCHKGMILIASGWKDADNDVGTIDHESVIGSRKTCVKDQGYLMGHFPMSDKLVRGPRGLDRILARAHY